MTVKVEVVPCNQLQGTHRFDFVQILKRKARQKAGFKNRRRGSKTRGRYFRRFSTSPIAASIKPPASFAEMFFAISSFAADIATVTA